MKPNFFSKIIEVNTNLNIEEVVYRLEKVNTVPTVSYWSEFERHSFKINGKQFKLIKTKINEESSIAKGEIVENGEIRTVRFKLISYDTLMISILFIPIFVTGILYSIITQDWTSLMILLVCLPVYYFLSFHMKKRAENRYIKAFQNLLVSETIN